LLFWSVGRARHEQQFVAVRLREGTNSLGDMCPRCWSGSAEQTAERVRSHAAQLLAQGLTPNAHPEQESAAARWERAQELLRLADRLTLSTEWAVPLPLVLEAEKAALRKWFPGFREEDLRRVVDERYRELLARSE